MISEGTLNETTKERIAQTREHLSQLFGSYKAEWLKDKLFTLFKEPTYFPDLTTASPCVLLGGRGTGKTTVLRCLSYEGQYALSGFDSRSIPEWSYYGMYYRINTNRVTAFKGEELTNKQWVRLFSHYLNLRLCTLIFQFLRWYSVTAPQPVELSSAACRKIGKSLHVAEAKSIADLEDHLEVAQIEFEAYINNVVDGERPGISMPTAPVDALIGSLAMLPQFKGKNFFFLLDEYENLEDYQQQVVNTYIKHSGELYSFKIGVRELGWRRRTTLQENEQLISPADYVMINIGERLNGKRFRSFARSVCNERFAWLAKALPGTSIEVKDILPGVDENEEANLLGVRRILPNIIRDLKSVLSANDLVVLETMPPLEVYFLRFWAESNNLTIKEVFDEAVLNPHSWRSRFGNYKRALLFTIRKKVRGINKYYAGWDVFTQLSGNNIRYLLELVEKSVLSHLQENGDFRKPISPKTQTLVAQEVGHNYLSELEGLSIHGADLTKLLLGLGRVFQVMARDALGHAPEVNQFHLSHKLDDMDLDQTTIEAVERLLTSAVMHLALIRPSGTKLGDSADTRVYDYMVHPIFSAYFVFSYRKKRKMLLTGADLLGLVKDPKPTIRSILTKNHRVDDEHLPEQLTLFEAYYDSSR